MNIHWKGVAIAGIWIGVALLGIFSDGFTEKIALWALWATFWVTIAPGHVEINPGKE